MKKGLALKFFRDRSIYIVGYVVGIGLLVLYNYLTESLRDELYVISLSFFVLLVVLIVDWIRYYRFYSNLVRVCEDDYFQLEPVSCEQKEISLAISVLQEKYMKEISRINMEASEKQHFLSQWIHNMKTPVSVMDLILQKISMEELLEDKLIKDLQEEKARLYNGLDQILNIMRLEEFSRDYEPDVVNLVDNLKDVINSKKSQFIYSGVFPKLEFEQDSIKVITDSKWNKFMLEQIITNAIKYSKTDSARKYITFSLHKESDRTRLFIKDEGVGIPDYDIRRVFEPFFTGDNGRTFKSSTGIGLYICSKIAEKLGHKIDIESAPGKGTTVAITYIIKL